MKGSIPPVTTHAFRRRLWLAAREETEQGTIKELVALRLPGDTDRTEIKYNLRGRRIEITACTKGVGSTNLYLDLALQGEAQIFEICELFRDEAEHYRSLAKDGKNIEKIILDDYRCRPRRWGQRRKGEIKVAEQFKNPGSNVLPPPILVTHFRSFLDDLPDAQTLLDKGTCQGRACFHQDFIALRFRQTTQ